MTTTINYEAVFNLFIGNDNSKDHLLHPFRQKGNYCATDAHSLIYMPVKEANLPFREQEKPNLKGVIPTEFHEPIEIDVAKFEAAVNKHVPLIDEFEIKKGDCKACGGEGIQECDMGHDHDCPSCDGEGQIEINAPTGKMIPYEKTFFFYMEAGLSYIELKRLINAAKMIGEEKIYKVTGSDKKPFLFKVGKANILIAHVVFDNKEDLVILNF